MYSVETLFDHIIKSLYERAKSLGINIKKEKCVITVPSYFDNKRRSVISHICKQNHLNVTRFLNESTSVVLNHIHMEDMIDVHINESSIILVVDIGGGTTDFTIATVGSDFIRVLGTSGNIDLGGNILTDRLCRYLSKKYDFASNVNIWFLSEHIKTELSKNEHTKFMTKFGLKIIRRSTFDSLINDISDNCISMLLSLLKRTNYITPDIKTVIYSGGCSNVPLLRSMISDTLSGAKVIPLYKDEFAVCHGACLMLSSIVICNKFLIDVVPLNVGVELSNGSVEVMMSSNTCIPFTSTCDFRLTPTANNEKRAIVNIIEYDDSNLTASRTLLCRMVVYMNIGTIITIRIDVSINGLFTFSAIENGNVIKLIKFYY
jgi:L1 cell adhesion molecule like protein